MAEMLAPMLELVMSNPFSVLIAAVVYFTLCIDWKNHKKICREEIAGSISSEQTSTGLPPPEPVQPCESEEMLAALHFMQPLGLSTYAKPPPDDSTHWTMAELRSVKDAADRAGAAEQWASALLDYNTVISAFTCRKSCFRGGALYSCRPAAELLVRCYFGRAELHVKIGQNEDAKMDCAHGLSIPACHDMTTIFCGCSNLRCKPHRQMLWQLVQQYRAAWLLRRHTSTMESTNSPKSQNCA
jgi:hypothetical protein